MSFQPNSPEPEQISENDNQPPIGPTSSQKAANPDARYVRSVRRSKCHASPRKLHPGKPDTVIPFLTIDNTKMKHSRFPEVHILETEKLDPVSGNSIPGYKLAVCYPSGVVSTDMSDVMFVYHNLCNSLYVELVVSGKREKLEGHRFGGFVKASDSKYCYLPDSYEKADNLFRKHHGSDYTNQHRKNKYVSCVQDLTELALEHYLKGLNPTVKTISTTYSRRSMKKMYEDDGKGGKQLTNQANDFMDYLLHEHDHLADWENHDFAIVRSDKFVGVGRKTCITSTDNRFISIHLENLIYGYCEAHNIPMLSYDEGFTKHFCDEIKKNVAAKALDVSKYYGRRSKK